MDCKDQALLELGKELRAYDYRFTTITPASHARVNGRAAATASPLARLFGWSRAVRRIEVPDKILALLDAAEELQAEDDFVRSKVRFSSLDGQLYLHSPFPTEAADTVFFGPDTYRFARALRAFIAGLDPAEAFTIIDIGCGSGAGGLHAADLLKGRTYADVILADINPKALRFSRINAALNGVANVRTVQSDVFEKINEGGNLIISNPPYLVDRAARLYRHGGGEFGFELSLRIVRESLDRLYPGGALFLYTGAAVVDGRDTFFDAVRPHLDAAGRRYSYDEIDPDVFGEELEHPPYDRVDRIAVVALTVHA
jgi:methylase of polypeptide subunit release factors